MLSFRLWTGKQVPRQPNVLLRHEGPAAGAAFPNVAMPSRVRGGWQHEASPEGCSQKQDFNDCLWVHFIPSESVSLSDDYIGCLNLSSVSAFSCFLLLIPQAAYFSRLAESAAPSLFIVGGVLQVVPEVHPTGRYRRAPVILRVVFPCRSPRDGLGDRKWAGAPADSLGQSQCRRTCFLPYFPSPCLAI